MSRHLFAPIVEGTTHRRRGLVGRGVDLAVEPRSRAALVGRNGAGKSTLMKVVMGLIEPDGRGGWTEGLLYP